MKKKTLKRLLMVLNSLNTQGTQDEEKQNKNTTQYVLDTTILYYNVNKTRTLLQTTNKIFSCQQT